VRAALSVPLVIVLLLVAALTAGGMAVRSVSRIWLRHWAERQLRGSAAAAAFLERPHRLLTSANVGGAMLLVIAGMIIGVGGAGIDDALPALACAGFVILEGQIVPRAFARRFPSAVAPWALPLLRLTEVVTVPVIGIGRGIAKVFITERPENRPPTDRDPIQDLLREGELEGVGEREEIAIISGVGVLSDKVVSEVMTPRSEIFALPDGVDPHTLASQIAQSRYSRVPMYHGTLDHITGMVHVFDVIKAEGDMPDTLRPVAFSTPTAPCNELLFRMLRERLHIAIVQDGSHTVGLVTLEDLLEELGGDIRDEHDEPEPPRTK
jgi:putative hemolysin